MAQTFGMISEYGKLNRNIGSTTTTTTKQPEENYAQPEVKKHRVQATDPKEATTQESGQQSPTSN
jgi:hypothetical protein